MAENNRRTDKPWYRSAVRWAQTNLVEIDPDRYDDAWWREHWRKTRVDGAIINAGGIVAYYPSEVELHYRAAGLGERDLYGDIAKAAREEGLAVVARMDSNRVSEAFYRAHPDWICVDAEGTPYRTADKYITCINSPYYWDYLPRILKEIIDRSAPDGFADNSWAGLPRQSTCHCDYCRVQFREISGLDLPTTADWDNESYRRWVRWNYDLRVKLWAFNNEFTRKHGGEHCHWFGMLSGDFLGVGERFVDLRRILAQSEAVMLDHQRRNDHDGFAQNTEAGKRLHGMLGWDKLIPESTPQYQLGNPVFRHSSMPPAEVRLWSSAGFAGGIQPWWHHIGSCHDDRRQYQTAEPIFSWHADHEDILVNRAPVAEVGIVWSQDNNDFFGRAEANNRTRGPYRGIVKALDRAGIDYLPIHADDVSSMDSAIRVLVLPNVGAMSDDQLAAVRAFAAAGGSLIITGETGLYDENGDRRAASGLEEIFGLTLTAERIGEIAARRPNMESKNRHSYLRLSPPLRGSGYGPKDPNIESAVANERHAVLKGLDATDSLPFGGYLPVAEVDGATEVLATYIPEFPIFPPETSFMKEPVSDIPAIVARDGEKGARHVWFLADIDRLFGRDGSFEHAMLLTNAVDDALDGDHVVRLKGTHGQITATVYRQDDRIILHLNNRLLAGMGTVPGRQEALIPIGPVEVSVRAKDAGGATGDVTLTVAGTTVKSAVQNDRLIFEIPTITDHEVVILGGSS